MVPAPWRAADGVATLVENAVLCALVTTWPLFVTVVKRVVCGIRVVEGCAVVLAAAPVELAAAAAEDESVLVEAGAALEPPLVDDPCEDGPAEL